MIKQVREAEHVDQGVFDQEHLFLDKEAFSKCVGSSIGVIGKALKKQLVIPDWPTFTSVMTELYEGCRGYTQGQSVSKPFTYALVHDELGPEELHSHVGQEPSGRLFNDISLDHNSRFLSERETADRNYALSYYMREHKVFPPDTNLQDTLDLYFQLCSIETNCDTLAVMAATLANGGVNPMNGERIINN
ncbi:glutaminase, partial [Ancylostoma duodenale]